MVQRLWRGQETYSEKPECVRQMMANHALLTGWKQKLKAIAGAERFPALLNMCRLLRRPGDSDDFDAAVIQVIDGMDRMIATPGVIDEQSPQSLYVGCPCSYPAKQREALLSGVVRYSADSATSHDYTVPGDVACLH